MFFKKNKIVFGKIEKIDLQNGLYVELQDGTHGIVPLEHIGTISPSMIKHYFTKYENYKFKIIADKIKEDGLIYLSYKLCHPYLIKNKTRILSTSNNFKNMRKALILDLQELESEHPN